jgi:ribosomal protein S18 acetylase RimI-like enzyme
MPKKPPPYLITTDQASIQPLLPQIVAAADQERHSFGFMPARAYATVALEGRLIVALHSVDASLVGYTMLGGTFPQARIFQTYVSPTYRGTGVGQCLLHEAISRCERLSYLSIRADVADDLTEANRFYRDAGFRSVRRKKGGAKTGRAITIRVRELSSPSLLDLATYGALTSPPPRIHISTSLQNPLYLIDLNVLFDVTKRRARAAAAGRVFAAAADNSVKLALSEEFIVELERNSRDGAPDPTLELAKHLPRLPLAPAAAMERLKAELAPLCFPMRAAAGVLTAQDCSDLAHLATAIHEGARGFVTSEKAILAQAQHLASRYELDVLSPESFGKDYASGSTRSESYQLQFEERDIWCRSAVEPELEGVRRLAEQQEVPTHVIQSALASGTSVSPRRRVALGSGQTLIAFASWEVPRVAVVERRAYVFVDANDPAADLALDYLLTAMVRDSVGEAPFVLSLSPSPSDTLLRLKAIAIGFRPKPGSSSRAGKLEKVCFDAVFTTRNWFERRSALEKATSITLQADPPAYREPGEEMRILLSDRHQIWVPVDDIENLLSPAIFATGERSAVIVPIKPAYAEELFAGSTQRTFLHENRAIFRREKRYFSNRRTYRTIPEAGLIVFYESGARGGRSSAVAIGRIRRRYLASEEVAGQLTLESGVVRRNSLERMARGEQVCVTEFDNVALFKRAVPLSQLKEMGCADAANLVTARAIDPPALQILLSEAFSHA